MWHFSPLTVGQNMIRYVVRLKNVNLVAEGV